MLDGIVNTTTTVSGPVDVAALLEMMRKFRRSEPERVIVAPSLAALMEAIPGIVIDPSGRRTMDGIRVVFSKHVDRVLLVPAEWLGKAT